MVRGPDDPLYTRLAEKYNRLAAAGSTLPIYCAPLPVSTIVRNAPDALKAVFVVEVNGNLHTIESKNTEPGYSQGTGFAYGNNRILVTCDHVLRFRLDDEAGTAVDCESAKVTDLEIVAKRPNSTADWHLKILHRDRGRDLAILKFVDEPPAMRYFTHAEVPIKKNRQGSLLGFPNWSPGRDANHEDAMVTNRYRRSDLERFEIEKTVRQGTSGGPFIDELFRVVGIAQQGATQQTGNNECLCVRELESWIASLPRLS
jgi:S1-C subfamily serine protease